MTQSSLTVTTPNPTPPTNLSFTGVTGPNPPNYTKNSYANPFNLSAIANAGGPALVTDQRPQSPYGVNQAPPPYFDDGISGAGSTINEPSGGATTTLAFATNTGALAGGTSTTSGGTENTYPGIGGLTPPSPNMGGAVPASTSVAHEGASLEVVTTQTYSPTSTGVVGVLVPGSTASYLPTGQTPAWSAGMPGGPLRVVVNTNGASGAFNGVANPPNAAHASSLSPSAATTLTSISQNNTASGGGTILQVCTGTNFTRQSVIWVNGVAQVTTFNSSTSIQATVTKKSSSGNWPVVVITAGATTTAPQTWTFT